MSRYSSLICLLFVLTTERQAAAASPCESSKTLIQAIGCIKQNEPSFRDALSGKLEASELESSAYRLINPELSLEFLDGKSFGDVQRQATGSLLFTLELGGKRGARALVNKAEGLVLQADAFEQQILALTELGAALLKLSQLEREKAVLQESSDTFRRVIRLFKSRGSLPPEQKVSLNAFELIVLTYDQKLLDVDAELLRFQTRTEKLFGSKTKGQPLDASQFATDIKRAENSLGDWLERTPEMLRLRAEQLSAAGQLASARSEMWPDVKIGPSFQQTTSGAITYQQYGVAVSFPLPLLSWNGALRTSRELTDKRVQSKARWESQDIRAKYVSTLSQLERIIKLLRDLPSENDIQKKHASAEGLYDRGLVNGALMIESHRALVEYYETKHSLESRLLEDSLKIQQLLAQEDPS